MRISTTCLVILALLLVVPVSGHIHSHKVHVQTDRLTLSTWIYALLSSAAVGACGVFPLLVNRWIRLDRDCKKNSTLRGVLCFSVGGLLGDVFLHLLPEAFGDHDSDTFIGLWVIAGLLTFLIIEKIVKLTQVCTNGQQADCPQEHQEEGDRQECVVLPQTQNRVWFNSNYSNDKNGFLHARLLDRKNLNGPSGSKNKELNPTPPRSRLSEFLERDISGYLNLLANCTDNFTHGLAIAASYVASPMVGLLTTVAILCHEIPHEIGDFAILLNSGFSLKEAAKAQVVTATGGLFGVVAGLTAEHLSSVSSWLLPFTAGGFLYIALVSIVPDILEDLSVRCIVVQLVSLAFGVLVMAMVTIVEKRSCNYVPARYLESS